MSNVRRFFPPNERTWVYQNDPEYMDYREGCLCDNFLCCTKRGYVAAYEKYVNEWCSKLVWKFASHKDEDAVNELLDEWDKFAEQYEGE